MIPVQNVSALVYVCMYVNESIDCDGCKPPGIETNSWFHPKGTVGNVLSNNETCLTAGRGGEMERNSSAVDV